MKSVGALSVVILLGGCAGCIHRPVENPNIIVMGITSGPNNLDPRIASDDTSQKLGQLIFSSLMTLDDHLRAVPQLAEKIESPDPSTWVITVYCPCPSSEKPILTTILPRMSIATVAPSGTPVCGMPTMA